ncbi:DUF3040 domain-containing protein [Actinoplanes sp. NPDC051494]|uniref:DUF3040 domain-containing protein n=1 Tax=Actinoplanes sp. NPDC051494 TaxID=3363907 RepID=UPI00378E40F3
MLNKEDTRRLALLERQLRRDDPDFCARMAGGHLRRRVPISLVFAATMVWGVALILAVIGWWAAAIVSGIWALVIMVAIAYRVRAPKITAPDTLPPGW